MSNPYKSAEDFQFWSRAVTWPAVGLIDPATSGAVISSSDLVSTMGSCFAQHIARHLSSVGCTYHVTERAPAEMSAEEALSRNYGVFTARYGNVYTVRQAVQLFRRAFGEFVPNERAWHLGGRLVDPFRPQIEPQGFATVDDLEHSRLLHLECVRELFLRSGWFVFTLGLTEGWRDKSDGAVFPLAPGVNGGEFDPGLYEFVNFDVDEVRADLIELIELIRSVNAGCRIILTVSPVPLIATFEKRHVLSSTVYSKSVLRVAADEAERRYDHVYYFPSFELITSPATAGLYYHDDFRQVREEGVRHVMKVFSRHFIDGKAEATRVRQGVPDLVFHNPNADVVCDEETIEHALRESRV